MEVSGDEGGGGGGEVLEVIKCESCGFTEECTSTYISRIRERYCGLWICGLCIEVVKDEILRSSNSSDQQRSKNNNNNIIISTEEALKKHINVCKSFQSATASSQQHPIFAMGKLLRKSLDSPRSLRSSAANPPSPLHEVNPPSFVH